MRDVGLEKVQSGRVAELHALGEQGNAARDVRILALLGNRLVVAGQDCCYDGLRGHDRCSPRRTVVRRLSDMVASKPRKTPFKPDPVPGQCRNVGLARKRF